MIVTETQYARVRLHYLDGLRALAALFVVLHHAWAQVWPVFTTDRPDNWPHGWVLRATGVFFYGHFAVGIFIVLSGFCLMLPVVYNNGALPGGIYSFFIKRMRRILPAYLGALAVCLILIAFCIGQKTGGHWDCAIPVTGQGLLTHLLLVQDIFGNSEIDYPMWSVAVEWHIYFLFPVLILCWKRYGAALTTVILLLLSYNLCHTPRLGDYQGVSPQFFGLFVLGMLAATISFSGEKRWTILRERCPWSWISVCGVIVLTALCRRMGFHRSEVIQNDLDFILGGIVMTLLVAIATGRGIQLRRVLEWKPLVWIGGFSYSLYLIHAPLLQLIWQYGLYPLHLNSLTAFLVYSFLGLPIIVILSYAFYRLCERPFLPTNQAQQGETFPLRKAA